MGVSRKEPLGSVPLDLKHKRFFVIASLQRITKTYKDNIFGEKPWLSEGCYFSLLLRLFLGYSGRFLVRLDVPI